MQSSYRHKTGKDFVFRCGENAGVFGKTEKPPAAQRGGRPEGGRLMYAARAGGVQGRLRGSSLRRSGRRRRTDSPSSCRRQCRCSRRQDRSSPCRRQCRRSRRRGGSSLCRRRCRSSRRRDGSSSCRRRCRSSRPSETPARGCCPSGRSRGKRGIHCTWMMPPSRIRSDLLRTILCPPGRVGSCRHRAGPAFCTAGGRWRAKKRETRRCAAAHAVL